MYGWGDDSGYDAHCESCGAGYHFEVGFQITCDKCGGPLQKPSPTPELEVSDDDPMLDPDFMNFDEVKAFKYMKEHGLLQHAYRVEPDPVQDFLDAVDGPEDLFAYEMTLPPGWSVKPINPCPPIDHATMLLAGKALQQFGIPKKIIKP
jgi:hypothetical protein